MKIICGKCHEGVYEYIGADRDDWENHTMKCKNCGFEETLKQHCDRGLKVNPPADQDIQQAFRVIEQWENYHKTIGNETLSGMLDDARIRLNNIWHLDHGNC